MQKSMGVFGTEKYELLLNKNPHQKFNHRLGKEGKRFFWALKVKNQKPGIQTSFFASHSLSGRKLLLVLHTCWKELD